MGFGLFPMSDEAKLTETTCVSEDITELTEIIYVEDIFRHWPGITEHELIQIIHEKKLPAYISVKYLIKPDGSRIHQVERLKCVANLQTKSESNNYLIRNALISSNIIFNLHDIIMVEEDHDDYCWKSGEPPVDQVQKTGYNSKQSERYACDRLSRRWRCNVRHVLAALDNRKSGFLKYFPDKPIPGVEKLAYFHVIHDDLMRWERDNEDNNFRIDPNPTAKESHENNLKALTEENASLKAENSALRQELAALMAPEASPVFKTTKASEAKRDKTAKGWAEDLEKAVALAVECARNGVPKSIKQHQTMWAKLWGDTESNEPHKAAFRAFRKGLPSELKSRKKE
ncbi:MAG: hypothetical protein KKA55_08030 [Proteobacteria bacterium]|nr:hypothetical protein [Pseudomonadota bacterium]MBU1595465.1 hypothetical protein [Pseudomonadota bacterium]